MLIYSKSHLRAVLRAYPGTTIRTGRTTAATRRGSLSETCERSQRLKALRSCS
jgi:hypothetical protein